MKATVLAMNDPEAPTKISADASSHGLGAVLVQSSGEEATWKPVAYASCACNEEALATIWACDKFAPYILGKKVQVETDHNPLVPLLSTKHLDNMPPRVFQFSLRLARYHYTISHLPGKYFYTADTLSRAPIPMDPWIHTHGTHGYGCQQCHS